MTNIRYVHKALSKKYPGMLRFDCMESILFDCPEYSVNTLFMSRHTFPSGFDWPLLRNLGFEANPTLAENIQIMFTFLLKN